jgi:hypothetical protein
VKWSLLFQLQTFQPEKPTIYSALSAAANTWLCKMNQNEYLSVRVEVFAEVEDKMLGTQNTVLR